MPVSNTVKYLLLLLPLNPSDLIFPSPVVKSDEGFSLHGSKKYQDHLFIKYRLSPFHMLCPSIVGVLRTKRSGNENFSSVPSRVSKLTFRFSHHIL